MTSKKIIILYQTFTHLIATKHGRPGLVELQHGLADPPTHVVGARCVDRVRRAQRHVEHVMYRLVVVLVLTPA